MKSLLHVCHTFIIVDDKVKSTHLKDEPKVSNFSNHYSSIMAA